MEQKSGYVLQTALVQGKKHRITCESQHRGEQETVSGVQIHQNSELWLSGKESGYITAKLDPGTQLEKSSHISEQLFGSITG